MLVLLLSITVITIIIPVDGEYKGSSTPEKNWEGRNLIQPEDVFSPREGARSLRGRVSSGLKSMEKYGKSKASSALKKTKGGSDYDDETEKEEPEQDEPEQEETDQEEPENQDNESDEKNEQEDQSDSEVNQKQEDEENPDDEVEPDQEKDAEDERGGKKERKPRVVLLVPVPKGRGKEMASKEGMIKYLAEIFPDIFGNL